MGNSAPSCFGFRGLIVDILMDVRTDVRTDGRTYVSTYGRTDGRTYGRTDGRTDGRTENLPILQDFVPYRGRCPVTAQLQPKNCIKWGKGTADHMMPLGNWLSASVIYIKRYFPINI